MTTREGLVKKAVRELLTEISAESNVSVYTFMPVQRGFGPPGLDFFCCIDGRFIAIETKVLKKKLEPRQVIIAKMIAAAGGLVVVVRGIADLDMLERLIGTGDRGKIYDTLGDHETYGEFWCS